MEALYAGGVCAFLESARRDHVQTPTQEGAYMRRLYRWLLRPLCRTAWTAGFDAGVAAERDAMLQLSMAQRERWYFVSSATDRRRPPNLDGNWSAAS